MKKVLMWMTPLLIIMGAGFVVVILLSAKDDRRIQHFFDDCSFQGGQPVQTSAVLYVCVGDDGRIIPITSRP